MPATRRVKPPLILPPPPSPVSPAVRWRHLPGNVTAESRPYPWSTYDPRTSLRVVTETGIHVYTCTHTHTHTRTHTHIYAQASGDEVKSLGSATDHRRHRRHHDGHHAEAYHPLDSLVNPPLRSHPLIAPTNPIGSSSVMGTPPRLVVFRRARCTRRSMCMARRVPGYRDATRRQTFTAKIHIFQANFRERVNGTTEEEILGETMEAMKAI